MQAIKLQIVVDDVLVQALPELSVLLGQRIELIALYDETKVARKLPTPGALAGQMAFGENFDAPLPDDIRRAFEGDEDDH